MADPPAMLLPPLVPTRNMASRRKAQPKVANSREDSTDERESSPPSFCSSHEPLNACQRPPILSKRKPAHPPIESAEEDNGACVTAGVQVKRRVKPSQRDREAEAKHDESDKGDEARESARLIPRDLSHVPQTLQVSSINDAWFGTFFLHEFLLASGPASSEGTDQLRHPHGRLPACVTDGRTGARITPREAERRAGKGSRKAWKQTLRVVHRGRKISLQMYMTQLGVEGSSSGDVGSGSGGDEITEIRVSKSETTTSRGETLPTMRPIPAWWSNDQKVGTSAMQQGFSTNPCLSGSPFPLAMLPAFPTAWLGHPPPVAWPSADTLLPMPLCSMPQSVALPHVPSSKGPELVSMVSRPPEESPCSRDLTPSSLGQHSSHPPGQEELLIAKTPATIKIFGGDEGNLNGTFYLHDFLRHWLPTKPLACIELMTPAEGLSCSPSLIRRRLTPTAAEAYVGRGCSQNWRDTFKTLHGGRILTLSAYFSVIGVDASGQ